MIRLTDYEVEQLREVRRMLRMETCEFDPPGAVGLDVEARKEFTDTVREATRVWRESWLLPVLDDILDAPRNQDGTKQRVS